MPRPASTRALGVVEILELVANFVVDEVDEEVNRRFDAVAYRKTPDSTRLCYSRGTHLNGGRLSWLHEQWPGRGSEQISLYHPLSASAATGARVGCGLGGTYSTLAFLRDLTEITFEKPYGSVVYLSPRLVRRPAPWSALTTLTIELTSLPSILSETIHEMLSALKGLNQLRFAAPQRSSAVDASTTDWITVLRRLPANITRFGVLAKSEGKTPINSLLAVLRTYLPPSVEELELVLPTVYTRQSLSLMLPPAVKRVSIECQRALCVPLLELPADPTILPELVQGPAISFTVADTVESSEIRLPTFKSVQAAVAGMNRRLRIADKKGAEHFLYKLLEDSGMSPSQ